jgi:predicted nucleic acid-binding protein
LLVLNASDTGINLILFPTAADWKAAWAAYDRGEATQAGIVDQISFIVMRRLGIPIGLVM